MLLLKDLETTPWVFTRVHPTGGAEAQNEKEEQQGGALGHSIYQKDFVTDSQQILCESEKSKHFISFLSHITSSPFVWKL